MGNNDRFNLEYLIELSKKEGFYKGEKNIGYESQLREVINIIENFEGFKNYLEEKQFDDYCWTYFIFGLIINYLEICYSSGNLKEIKNIFKYLDSLAKSDDEYIINLLVVGCLEGFGHYKPILPKLVELMPISLKSVFMNNFSHYLR